MVEPKLTLVIAASHMFPSSFRKLANEKVRLAYYSCAKISTRHHHSSLRWLLLTPNQGRKTLFYPQASIGTYQLATISDLQDSLSCISLLFSTGKLARSSRIRPCTNLRFPRKGIPSIVSVGPGSLKYDHRSQLARHQKAWPTLGKLLRIKLYSIHSSSFGLVLGPRFSFRV